MMLKCTELVIALCLFHTVTIAQFKSFKEEKPFLDHLTEHELYHERLFLLEGLKNKYSNDTILAELGWTYLRLAKQDTARSYFRKVDWQTFRNYYFVEEYASLLFTLRDFEEIYTLEKNGIIPPSSIHSKNLQTLQKKVDVLELPQSIAPAYRQYVKYERKSSFLAGTYSLVIPGLGKVYAGQKRQGLNAFITTIAFGLQAYESYRKAGIESPRFIIFGSLFALYHLSNIYGSYKAVKKRKVDHRNQLLYEIDQYYYSKPAAYPY